MKAICASLFVLAAAGLFAQAGDAFVREITGTVEVKAPGQTAWEPVQRGQRLSGDTLISTGFKSQAVVVLGNSTLIVRPLTRLSIAEIARLEAGERVNLELQAGRIKVDVKPPARGAVAFAIRSPRATAAVRGTVFEFDTVNLEVSEGTVEFAGAGAPVLVDSGGAAFVDESTGRTVPPAETAAAALRPELPAGAEAALAADPALPEPPAAEPLSRINVGVAF